MKHIRGLDDLNKWVRDNNKKAKPFSELTYSCINKILSTTEKVNADIFAEDNRMIVQSKYDESSSIKVQSILITSDVGTYPTPLPVEIIEIFSNECLIHIVSIAYRSDIELKFNRWIIYDNEVSINESIILLCLAF